MIYLITDVSLPWRVTITHNDDSSRPLAGVNPGSSLTEKPLFAPPAGEVRGRSYDGALVNLVVGPSIETGLFGIDST